MARKLTRSRQLLAMTAMVAGVGLGTAGIASAATSTTGTTGSTGSSSSTSPSSSAAPDPATLAHGPGETLLTGTTLTRAVAAAEAAEPGATVVRAETDAQGATYEVHMKKADGSYVTVKLDAAFAVTATESGFGAGPPSGAKPPLSGSKPPPSGTKPPSSSSSN